MMGIIGIIINVVFFGVFIWLAYKLIKGISNNGDSQRGANSGDRALEILKERYAMGEITKEEFEEMRRNLQ